ncbi:hypothetical protein FIBSPDRAFT_959937 [Athelia psychrophila]|uniref:Uncharacterized protein n=1 Tax=Athelia psychrophila TaxID=1759441 RepID=A0A166CXH2_9AGAM|nr:hypothetical protein FIBSPDRAFT_959937 [Fibularhizoctonia sp. CBS 109695]
MRVRYDSAPNAGGTPFGYNSPSGFGCLTEEPSPLDSKGGNHTIAQPPVGLRVLVCHSAATQLFGPIAVRYPEDFGVLPRIFSPESHGDLESRMQAYPNVASEWRLRSDGSFADAGIGSRKFHAQDQTYSPPFQLPFCVSNLSTVLSTRITWETVEGFKSAPSTALHMPFRSENTSQNW